MKTTMLLRSGLALLVLGMALPPPEAAASGKGLMERIQAADKPLPGKETAVCPPPVKTIKSLESYQGGAFKVTARKDQISRYRCSTCHTKKAAEQPRPEPEAAQAAHGGIEIRHGKGSEQLTCFVCHDQKNRDLLSGPQGRQIDFDHSYQLCGQCHFRQKRDWLGGAHGKREGCWAGERVVLNCTACHNPHAPAFPVKMPETYSLPLTK